jgi:hypothetical protein
MMAEEPIEPSGHDMGTVFGPKEPFDEHPSGVSLHELNPPEKRSPNKPPPLYDRDGWIYGGIGGGLSIALITVGLSVFFANHFVAGVILTLAGAVVLAVMIRLLKGHRLTIFEGLVAAVVASFSALVASWFFFLYYIWFAVPPTANGFTQAQVDIAKITAPVIAERDAAIKERDAAIKERDAARQGVTSAPPVTPQTPQPKWSDQEIATRSDLWHSIQNAMNVVVNAYNVGDQVLNQWEGLIPSDKNEYLKRLADFRKRVSDAADGIQRLRTDYPSFQDVFTTIDQPYLGPLLNSIDELSQAISALPEPLPLGYETKIRPLAGAVRVQMQNYLQWISSVRSTAGGKLNELGIMMIHK